MAKKKCDYCNETYDVNKSEAPNNNQYCSELCEVMMKIEGDFDD